MVFTPMPTAVPPIEHGLTIMLVTVNFVPKKLLGLILKINEASFFGFVLSIYVSHLAR